MFTTLTMAAGVGLLSTLHCIGMCGGIVAALAVGAPGARRGGRTSFVLALGYNGGRIASYSLLGLLAALVSHPFTGAPWAYRVLQGLGLLALVLAGLRLGGWLHGAGWIERVGLRLWRRVSPLTRLLLPVDRLSRAVPAGLLWGLLPCGLVYAMLPVAVGTGSPWGAAFTMMAFGAGTLPAMVFAGTLANRIGGLRPSLALRRYAGATLILLAGFWFGLQWLAADRPHAEHLGPSVEFDAAGSPPTATRSHPHANHGAADHVPSAPSSSGAAAP